MLIKSYGDYFLQLLLATLFQQHELWSERQGEGEAEVNGGLLHSGVPVAVSFPEDRCCALSTSPES